MRIQFVLALLVCVSGLAADVLTYHNDNARTGQNLSETVLTPVNVGVNTFGKLFDISLDGKVDAEPLYAAAVSFPGLGTHNVLYVVTEHDSVYAFDADSGVQLWKASMLQSGEATSDVRSCDQVSPEIGITSTPVISRSIGAHGTIYVVAMSLDSSGNYHHRLHGLDLTTGAEQFSGPTEVQATYPGTGDNTDGTNVIFDPKQYKDRAALLLLNGVVYTSWASHCDHFPYTGWVIGYSATSLTKSNVFNFNPNGSEGAVWMSGAGPAADAAGNIYFLAANGAFDTTVDANGFPANGDFGNAFMKLSVAGGVLGASDFFAMSNITAENNQDTDLGSGGALLLPDMTDSHKHVRHLAVGAGKDTHIYLVDRDNMGKFNAVLDGNYQDLPNALAGGEWAMPAFFNGALYYGGVNDAIRKFTFSKARLVTPASATTPNSFAYPGTTPSISANGNADGIVWAIENTNMNPAILHAYDAGDLHELYNSNQAGARDQFGAGTKFITPMIANGNVYIGTPNGISVFGILPAAPVITSALSASGSVNKAFRYQIMAANGPTSYSAVGLPAGLAVNTVTGLISGTPGSGTTTKVTIGATNANGTGTATLTITIRGKP